MVPEAESHAQVSLGRMNDVSLDMIAQMHYCGRRNRTKLRSRSERRKKSPFGTPMGPG